MNIRCNQKFVDIGPWYRFQGLVEQGIRVIMCTSLLEISTLSPGIMRFPLYRPPDGRRSLFNVSTVIDNYTFGAGVTKIYYNCIRYTTATLYLP